MNTEMLDESITLDGALEMRAQLIGERDGLLRRHYSEVLDILSLTDALSIQMQELRRSLTDIGATHLPHLEQMTTHDYVDRHVIRPHRDRTEKFREHIRQEHRRQQRELVERTVKLLRSDVTLPTCLRLVSTLRQQEEFIHNSSDLIKVFLEARNCFITNLIEESIVHKRHMMDDAKAFEAIIKVMREPVLDVISQYKASFADPYPLCRFVITKLEWFLSSIDLIIKQAKNTLILASYWNQLVLLNSSFSAIGGSFLPLIEPTFVQQAKMLLSDTALRSYNGVQSRILDFSMTATRRSGMTNDMRGNNLRPPAEILEYPVLVPIANSFVDVFEQVRVFAIPAIQTIVRELIQSQLSSYQTLLDRHFQDQKALLECYKEQLENFIIDVLGLYFPKTIDGAANKP